MYGDIIPPKKKYQDENTHNEIIHDEYIEDRKSVHFTPIKRQAYREPKSKKLPVFLGLLALIVIGFGVYHKIFNGTTFAITPKTTRFEIQQKIPLILQNREKGALTYSLVYVPEEGASRNPFTAPVDSTSTPTQLAMAAKAVSSGTTMTATTTGDVKNITLINKTSETVPLRIATRFDVNGVTYTLDAATNLAPSSQDEINKVATDTPQYKVIGFKGTSSYDTVFAIPVESTSVKNSTVATQDSASSTLPPEDILSLMPKNAIPLQKSTIYDKLVDQSAVVVFDEKVLEDYLNETNVQLQEYFKALKPFGNSISYTISVVDYTLVTSSETGKPTEFSNISIDVTPVIDNELLPRQFTGFKKDTMEKIEKQVSDFIELDISYTPFWSKSVAGEERITVK